MPLYYYFFPYHSWAHQLWFDALALVFLAVFVNWQRPLSMRNLDLLVLVLPISLGDYELGPIKVTALLAYLFLVYWWVRLVILFVRPPAAVPGPPTSCAKLNILSAILLTYTAGLVLAAPFPFGKAGDPKWCLSESSVVGVLGADQILHGKPPYGNVHPPPERRTKIYAIYGPAYFLLFTPFTLLAGAGKPFTDYALAARLTTLLLVLLFAFSMRRVGRKLAGRKGAAALGFGALALPYLHHAAYWSWTGNLLPGALAALLLLAAVTWKGTGMGLSAAAAGAAGYFPLSWVPVWFFRLPRGPQCLKYLGAAGWLVLLLFALAFAQPGGVDKFKKEVSSYAVPGQMPKWRYKWSPYRYYPWTEKARGAAKLALLPVFLGICLSLWRRKKVTLATLCAASALLTVNGQLMKAHAPGRMTLWALPFLLLLLLLGDTEAHAAEESGDSG